MSVIFGDFHTVAAGATLIGGKDTITSTEFDAVGDANEAYGTMIGDDDTIRVQAGGHITQVIGDVAIVRVGAIVTGGNDTLLSNEASGGSSVYGDSIDVFGKLVGGNDTITDGDGNSFLRGDAY